MEMNADNSPSGSGGRKIVLAFDTSVTGCSVCIRDNRDSWMENMDTDRGQAEFLVPMICSVLKNSGYDYKDIDLVAVTTGPGSFTGIRVGLSTAKSLALTLDKPLLGFESLGVIAKSSSLTQDTLILIDTKRGDFYGQIFSARGAPRDKACLWTDLEINEKGLPIIKDVPPDVLTLAVMAQATEVKESGYDPALAPSPLYLRGAEVSQSKRVAPKIIETKKV